MDSALIELLGRLIAIPSVNPEDTDDPAITGELRLADFLGVWLEERGFLVDFLGDDPQRPNVVASYGPDTPSRTILLEAHTDTVSVQGMSIPPFEARIADGRMYGRGACDTKGPMAAALYALQPERLERLAARGIQILFVGAMGEEKGNCGAEYLVKQGLRADEAIIFEPTDLKLVTAHKGALWLRLTLEGRAGHGSAPDEAISAIHAAARVIQTLETQARAAESQHPLLGASTLHIGKISGGSAVNIVADQCTLEVDRRMLPGEDRSLLVEETKNLLQQMRDEGILEGFHIDVLKSSAPFEIGEDAAMVQRFRKAMEHVGQPFQVMGTGWFSDAGPFSTVCGEAVVFGPGSIRQAHTSNEFIDLESLETGTRIVAEFLDRT